MLELVKEFLVIPAGVLAGVQIGRWIDKRFRKWGRGHKAHLPGKGE